MQQKVTVTGTTASAHIYETTMPEVLQIRVYPDDDAPMYRTYNVDKEVIWDYILESGMLAELLATIIKHAFSFGREVQK